MRSSAAEPGESPPAQYKTAQPVENGASTGKGRSAKRRALIHHISIQCAIFACCCSRMALRPVPAGAAHGMARAFPKRPIPLFDAEELVDVRVHLVADVFPRRQ